MPRLMITAAAALLLVTPALTPAFANGDPAAGEKDFRKCKACHSIASADEVIVKGGRTGPDLYGVIGRQAGTVDGFRYGADLVAAGEQGLVWNTENIQDYISDPRGFLQDYLGDSGAKAKMVFKLTKGQEDMAAYLATFSDAPAEAPADGS